MSTTHQKIDWKSDLWHNPEKAEHPGEGYRFLTKEESSRTRDKSREYQVYAGHGAWGTANSEGKFCPLYTYRTEDREHKATGFHGRVPPSHRLLRESEVLAGCPEVCLHWDSDRPHFWRYGAPQHESNHASKTFITKLESPFVAIPAKTTIAGRVDWTSDLWHNPEGVPTPGEGFRFLAKHEAATPADGETRVYFCLKPFSEGKWTDGQRVPKGAAFPERWTCRVPDLDHNPSEIASPGEGYRFLKKSEVLSQTIPAKAQYDTVAGWFDADGVRNLPLLATNTTVRVPIHIIPATHKQNPSDLVLPYHNPSGAESPGAGWRFLTAAEAAKPQRDVNREYELYLPTSGGGWIGTPSQGNGFHPMRTYRTPDIAYDCAKTPDDHVRARRESEIIEASALAQASWQPPVHNPDKVAPAPGWRLLTIFEMENPPLDAQFWSWRRKEWRKRFSPKSSAHRSTSYQTQAPLPEWHNPAGLTTPGEGFRFLTKQELGPLQLDCEVWLLAAQKWGASWNARAGNPPSTEYTYRTKAQIPRQAAPLVTCTIGACPTGVLFTTDGTVPHEDNPSTHRYTPIVPNSVNTTECCGVGPSTLVKAVACHPGHVAEVDPDHNPAKVASPGEGYRFLKVSELDTPVTEGAEVWGILSETWRPSANIGDRRGGKYCRPNRTVTYRVPVIPADPDHNPEGLKSPGEGFRFLKQSELEKDVPVGVEYWWEGRWNESRNRVDPRPDFRKPCAGFTYRLPVAPVAETELQRVKEALQAAEKKIQGQKEYARNQDAALKRRKDECAKLEESLKAAEKGRDNAVAARKVAEEDLKQAVNDRNTRVAELLDEITVLRADKQVLEAHYTKALDAAGFIREGHAKFGLTAGHDVFTDGLPAVAKYITKTDEQLVSLRTCNALLVSQARQLESKIERLSGQIVQML